MPDLRPVETFTGQMERLESRYLKEINGPLKEARVALLEALLRDLASLPMVARREFSALGSQVSALANQTAAPAENIVLGLTESLFGQVAKLYPDRLPDFSQAQRATDNRRREIKIGFGQNATGWVDILLANFLVELSRLRQADETPEAMADRLLAEQIADGRASVWRTGINLAIAESQRGLWTAANSLAGTLYIEGQRQTGERWRKQAIAAIDERTTDCCLRVHGQVQDLDKEFHLIGTPRFRDYIAHPPFHMYCRTAETLWVERFETVGITTAQMRDAANAEINARADGSRKEIHPANAISRR